MLYTGVTGPLNSVAVKDLLWLDITVKKGGVVYVPVSRESNVYVYMWMGNGAIGPPTGLSGEASLYCRQVALVPGSQLRCSLGLESVEPDSPDGPPPDVVRVSASTSSPDDVRLLLLAGAPLGRSFVFANGFFASTVQQLEEAIDAYNAGRLGSVGTPEQSELRSSSNKEALAKLKQRHEVCEEVREVREESDSIPGIDENSSSTSVATLFQTIDVFHQQLSTAQKELQHCTIGDKST